MPEIAEVEVTRRACDRFVGHRLDKVEVVDEKITDDFSSVVGKKLLSVERKGKRLGFLFEDRQMIICHLRMTGRLFLGSDPKSRATLLFDNGPVSFIDPRRFGTLTLSEPEDLAVGLGPDLFDDWPIAIETSKSSRAIKAVILDQTVIAGIGNYLADESLFKSKINPQRPASNLSAKDWHNLLTAARETALLALEGGGLSLKDYLSPTGEAGQMGLNLSCYGRVGQRCLDCDTILIKARVAGRGTTFCPSCQKS